MKIFSFVVHALACASLASCTIAKKDVLVAAGGRGAYKGGDFAVVWDNRQSFRDFMLAAAAIATSGFSSATTQAQEATAQIINTNQSKTAQRAAEVAGEVEIVKSNNATQVLLAHPPAAPVQ
jgi:hypothetical protein